MKLFDSLKTPRPKILCYSPFNRASDSLLPAASAEGCAHVRAPPTTGGAGAALSLLAFFCSEVHDVVHEEVHEVVPYQLALFFSQVTTLKGTLV